MIADEKRKHAERERDLGAAVYSAVQRASLDGILLVDSHEKIISYNDRFAAIWRVPPELLASKSDAPVLESVAEQVADRRGFLARVAELYAHPDQTAVDEILLKDGRTFDRYSAPVKLDDESYVGRVWFFRDVTERNRARQKVEEDASQFHALVEQQLAGIFIITGEGTLAYVNPRFTELLGYTPAEVIGRPFLDFVADSDWASLREAFAVHLRDGPATTQKVAAIKRKDGSLVDVLTHASIASYEGKPALIGLVVDITERRQAELALRDSEERMRTVFDSVSDGIVVYDIVAGAIIDANPRVFEMFGYTRAEMMGLDLRTLLTGISPYALEDALPVLKSAVAGTASTVEWSCNSKDGHCLWIEVSLRKTQFGGREILLATTRDITERKRIDEQVIYLARHDSLTGLANRAVFVDALQQATERAKRGSESFAVLYLDLDHFKDVNDTLGHPVGDLLLCSLAGRLRTSIRETDTVARFGGDEFALIQAGISEPLAAAALADKVLKSISAPFIIQGKEIRSGASIGIAMFGPDAPNAETLLSQADVALYRAKAEGRGTYRFFTDDMDAEVNTRVKLAAELREAISAGQMSLEYQPQVDVDTGRIIGVEALARWRHPTRGLIPPDCFVPVAEHSGLVVALGRWALQEACRQMKEWIDADIAPPLVAVNVSGLQFKTPLELEDEIAAILSETGLPPERLELELTESVLMDVSRDHNTTLQRLRTAGHRVAIDDFGTGYSSLQYLARFPVDRIKIAQGFIVDLTCTSSSQVIVKAAIGLAHDLNLDVVVEGVETSEQLKLIRSWGCRKVQGHFFSKALPAGELTALLLLGKIIPEDSLPAEATATRAA